MNLRCVPTLLALACFAQAADINWAGAPGDKPPAGWTLLAGAETSIVFQQRAIEITAPSGRQALAVAATELPDGSDDRPMRLSAQLSAWGAKPVDEYPLVLALEWGGGAVFAVGLGDDPHTKRDDRRAWALWNGRGVDGNDHGETELGAGASPAHLRIVLTTRELVAYGSRDGWVWGRIAGIARDRIGASGAPARVVVGRGQLRPGATGLAADPPGDAKGKPCTYRIAELRVEHGSADVPAALLRTYAKKDSLSDTVEEFSAAGMPRQWRVRGPDDGKKTELPVRLPEGFTAGDGWKPLDLGETGRILQLGKVMPGGGEQVRWATTEVVVAEAGLVRFRFDGAKRCWLWVANQLLSAPDRETNEAEIDRQSASVWLPAGTHQVVLAVRGGDGRASATLRSEPGDPRARIALLRRLNIDFTGDEQLIDAPFEIARLWEGLGFAREAVAALAEVAAAGDADATERALAERARLLHQVGDEAGATSETAALQKLWEGSAADPVSAARRTARLWQRLDVPERALGILGEALKLPNLDTQTRSGLAVDRARLRNALGDAPGTASELQAAAALLLPADPVRFDLYSLAARLDPTAKVSVDELGKLATDAQRARLIAGVQAARKDEPARLAARRLAAGLPGTPLALPAIELAEDLAAAKDEAGALKYYLQELTRRNLPAAPNLASARQALIRAVLGERAAGAALLVGAAKIPTAAAQPTVWKTSGPHPLGDWSPHEKSLFDVAKGTAAGPVAGKEWRDIPADAWGGGMLDIGRIGGGDNVVYYLTTTIGSDAERTANVSFGADDALTVWLNGERLYSDRAQRGLTPDSIVVALPLRKGVNVLVCSVQNGGGPSAFQYRMRREPWPASDIAAALAGDRAQSAQILADLATTLAASDRTDEAWALARAVIACWPERTDLIRNVAGAVITQPQWKLSPVALAELVAWFDAALADRRWDDAETRRWVAGNVPNLLVASGLIDRALNRLRRAQLNELEPKAVAAAFLWEADLWLTMGYPRQAVVAVQRARDAAPGDEEVDRWIDGRRRAIRVRKGDVVAIAAPFEMATLLRTAERALGSDPPRAASDLQQAIESGRDLAVQLPDGRLRGAAAYAAERLARADAAVTTPWHERQDERAAAALARTDGDDLQALAAISSRWSLAPAAGEALRREAGLWAMAGGWQLSLGTAQRGLAQAAGNAELLARAAEAAAHLGDVAILDGVLARITKAGGPVTWDGAQLAPDRFATAMRGLLPAAASAEPKSASLVVRLPRYADAIPRELRADARPPVPALAFAGDLLIVSTPSEIAAFAADGALRWRADDDRMMAGTVPQSLRQQSSAALAVDGGIAVAGLMRNGGRRLIAVDAANGRPLWNSADLPELVNAALASAPTMAGGRVWAWFVEDSRGVVVCLDAVRGRVLWRSTLAGGLTRQPMGGVDYIAAGDAPAPLLSGRELFVSSDAGQVGAYDAVDGRLLWLQAYPRTTINADSSRMALRRLLARGRGVVLADADRVYVAPRDTLGLLALRRSDGSVAWANELSDAGELCALTPSGLLSIGSAVTIHTPATGAERWRWRPASGRPGRPAVVGDAAWIPTVDGITRLALADGAATAGPQWSALGCGEARPNELYAIGGRVLALADGLVAVLTGGTAKPATAEIALRTRVIVGLAVPAGEAKPVALAARWEMPVGYVESLCVPRGSTEEAYVIAAGALRRIDTAKAAVSWAVPAPPERLRSMEVDGTSVLLIGEAAFSVHDRVTGRLRWQDVLDRDPAIIMRRDERWREVTQLDGDRVLRFGWNDAWYNVIDARDGRPQSKGRADGAIFGMHVVGSDLHLVVIRGNVARIEIRRLSDGVRVLEASLGLEGSGTASVHALPNDDLIIGGPAGGVLWRSGKREAVRFDLGMRSFHTVWRDGDRITIVGNGAEGWRHRTATIDPSGKLITQDEFMHHGDAADRLPWAARYVGDMRVRAVNNRNGQAGIIGWKADGAEAFWLPTREERRRGYSGLVPWGRYAVAFCNDRDGWLRAQIVDPQAGKIEVESTLGMSSAWRVQPQVVGSDILIGTTRGLIALVPVAGATTALPGRALGESHEPIWRMTKPVVVDGRIDEWDDQASWEQPAAEAARGLAPSAIPTEPLIGWAAWRDEAFIAALSVPLSPDRAAITYMAVDSVRGDFSSDARPLLLALDWNGGASTVRLVNRLVGDDPARPAIQARATCDGASLSWEVLIPWEWMYPSNERPGRDHWLRWGASVQVEQAHGCLELGAGLSDGFDKAVLTRLHLVDAKPTSDDKKPPRVVPRKGVQKKAK